MAADRLNKIYRNRHNQREVVCVDVRISDYGIYTWKLRGEDTFDCEVAEFDMQTHWQEIVDEDDVMDVDLVEEFKSHPLAWRRRATPEEVAARKAQEEE